MMPGACIALLFGISIALHGCGGDKPVPPTQDLDAWDRALKAHVSLAGELEGIPTHVVDYTALSKDPDFHRFVKSLDAVPTHDLTKNETYALFMNAYNAFAMKMIIDHPCNRDSAGHCLGPIDSIKEIGTANITVWKMPAGRIGGRMYSLDEIEGYLRAPAPFDEDSRVHACIVCASISCPNVRNEAFRAEKVDEQMADQVRDMLSNTKKGLALDRDSKTLTLSSIFKWFAADFEKEGGSVVDFLLPFMPTADQSFVTEHKDQLQLDYFGYDWNANGKVPCNCSAQTGNAQIYA